MSFSGPQSENCLLSIYRNHFLHNGVVWGQFTSADILSRCERFSFLPDDVLLATYPRSGTTLTQEIVWQVVNHDRIVRGEKYANTFLRFPHLEHNLKTVSAFDLCPAQSAIDLLPAQKGNRLIKTHVPFSLLRKEFEKVNPKMIVVMRNPKDNVVSCYNLFRGQQHLKEDASFSDYWRAYIAGKGINGDFCDFNLEYWSLRDRENVLMVRYEDLLCQPFQEVHKIALFLGYSLSAEQIATVVHNTTFDAMSQNEAVNWSLKSGTKFLRKGKAGDWKNWLTVAQSEAMDVWVDEKLSGTGLKFIYE